MKTQCRSSLYFGKYDLMLTFLLPEAFVLRKLDHTHIDYVIARRKEWGKKIRPGLPHPGSWAESWEALDITDEQVANLHKMCDFLINDERPRKMRLFGDRVYLYTTERSLIDDINDLDWIDKKNWQITRAVQVGTPNTVRLSNVKNAYRSYFQNCVISPAQKQSLDRFLRAQECLRMGPSLADFLEHSTSKRIFSYYFIDHNDPGIATMLNLICLGIVRKTLPIVADK